MHLPVRPLYLRLDLILVHNVHGLIAKSINFYIIKLIMFNQVEKHD